MPTIEDTIDALKRSGDHAAAQDVRRGQTLARAASGVVGGVPSVVRGAGRIGGLFLRPLEHLAPSVLTLAKGVGKGVGHFPKQALGIIGLTPILAAAAHNEYTKDLGQQLRSSAPTINEDGYRFASLNEDNNMLKKHFIKSAGAGTALGTIASTMPGAFTVGLGGGLAKGLVDIGFSGASALGRRAFDRAVLTPRREKVMYEAIKADNVLRDAIRGNEKVLEQLKEAFATLVRFAPTMAEDINAVRSYLRESVLSGGGINYATIKQLAETEKLVQERHKAVRSR